MRTEQALREFIASRIAANLSQATIQWYQDLRLNRLQVQWFHDSSGLVLWGTRGAEVRILWLKFLYNFREQYCGDRLPREVLSHG